MMGLAHHYLAIHHHVKVVRDFKGGGEEIGHHDLRA